MTTNQGTPIDPVFDAVSLEDISTIAAAIWRETANHPPEASCECPAIEALAVLIKLGYEVRKIPKGEAVGDALIADAKRTEAESKHAHEGDE